MKCERCPSQTSGYELFDYCAECSKNLCPDCMAKGCCGHVPAESGEHRDHGEDDDMDGAPTFQEHCLKQFSVDFEKMAKGGAA